MKTKFEKTNDARSVNSGFMLVEVLVSILLFAVGILALVGLQARALTETSDVQYRTEAIHFAEAYAGRIWAASSGGLSGPEIDALFSGEAGKGGSHYAAFSSRLTGAHGIPGAQAPTVRIVDASRNFNNQSVDPPQAVTVPSVNVTITILWADKENSEVVHRYTQTSSIGLNV
ncbi:MAG: hypothetical protein LBE75_03760 [Burkholderiales bacterium]|jgi:type IV pilus assembly protein PilV|nr:hypothetical protein [Burkholderiales bacterium]